MQNPEDRSRIHSSRMYGIDGVGGSGKSHVIRLLQGLYESEGLTSVVHKISGLGDRGHVRTLKQINDSREQILKTGEPSEKIINDKRSDRLFRLATKYQVRLFEKDRPSLTQDAVFLDRTPMLHWVYSSSVDPENPFLQEMHDEGIDLIRRMGISRIFFLKVAPSTAFARIIARTVALESSNDLRTAKIAELAQLVGAPQKELAVIHEKTFSLLSTAKIDPKPMARWDFIPYDVMQRESVRYEAALSDVQAAVGVPFAVIDAEQPIEHVVSAIRSLT